MTANLRAARCLPAFLLALLLATTANAQDRWAVQVVALRDYREAQATASDLRTLGFDAYTEFAMLDAQQWVRVRIGCYDSREAADAMAETLRTRITAQAQAVASSAGARVPGCTQETVGFLNAYGWQLLDDSGPVTFGVTVAGVAATVAHDGDRWRVVQDGGELPAAAVPAAAAGGADAGTANASATAAAARATTPTFKQLRVGGIAFVGLDSAPGPLVLCPGELVASVADVAVVVRGDMLVACRYVGLESSTAGA